MMILSMAIIFPNISTGQTTQFYSSTHFSSSGGIQGSNPNWVFEGAFLNYSATSNWNGKFTLSNGSSLSIVGNLTGSLKISVGAIQNQTNFLTGGTTLEANVTTTPNFAFKDKITYFNGTSQLTDMNEVPANASSGLVPLNSLNFGNILQNELNSTNQLYSFSPKLNVSLSSSPGVLYQLNSTTQVPALHTSASITESASIPSSFASTASGSYSVNGTSNLYMALAHDFPLSETISLNGATTIQNINLNTPGSASATGSFSAAVTLVATNVNLSVSGSVQQSTVQVPNYSTYLDVISNSTIKSAGTSGNQLLVNVTGPSGTVGILDIVVSPSLLSSAGITSISQVGVSLDGAAYSNYTVTDLGGSYVFIIYYHHSSHQVALSFEKANLGTNQGSISSLAGSNPTSMPLTTIYEIASVVIVVVVVAVAFAFFQRSRTKKAEPAAATPAQ